jgi:hypothetical protein
LSDELLTIHDLADRWGVSVDKAKKHVRRKQVPFVEIGTAADMQVNWRAVRFRLSAVVKWEEESQRVFEEPDPSVKAGTTPGPGRYKFVKMR